MTQSKLPAATLAAIVLATLAFAPARLRAQTPDTLPRRDSTVRTDTVRRDSLSSGVASRPTSTDSALQRARQLVVEGNGAAGRALADSVVASLAGQPALADALYWRGSLAATAADAERDYRRVIVDYPFSAHAGDAMLALAQLEMARGDRAAATEHLQRFLLEHADAPESARAGLWLGRLLLEQNQLPGGCAVLLRTRALLPSTEAELRNQIDYYAARCAGVDTTLAPPRRDSIRPAGRSPAASRPPAVRAAAPSTPPATPSGAAPSVKRYTVQVAAYGSRPPAEQLVARLEQRGIRARVVSAGAAPYRVRVGLYATEAEANALARELRGKGIDGFVTSEVAPGREPR